MTGNDGYTSRFTNDIIYQAGGGGKYHLRLELETLENNTET